MKVIHDHADPAWYVIQNHGTKNHRCITYSSKNKDQLLTAADPH